MVFLTGTNLGKRQRELNAKVAEVVTKKIKLDEIINTAEATDVDIFYKIDIASKYRDINVIIEILKCGDSLYITRALKCLWLYQNSYSHIINEENLHNNIFPYMSIKMKKKMLSVISMHLKDKDRAISFYIYCNNNNMSAIGFKFLNITSEEFKLQTLQKEGSRILCNYLNTEMVIKNFVKNSFKLATALLDITDYEARMLYNLRFMYSVSNENYLDMVEKKKQIFNFSNHNNQLGLRTSKDIMVKHKSRVLENPVLYISVLHQRVFVKYSTIDDAKKYINILMPSTVEEFWRINLCSTYKFIWEIIPENERWNYLKQIFSSHYPGEEFEMERRFYDFGYYKMLSVEERELWALRHIDEQKDFFGHGRDYIWYKFVNLDKALLEIKKYIMITPDADKRLQMLKILVESSRDQKDLIKLLNYYYDRHLNEIEHYKCEFVNEVLRLHNIFQFDLECWEALNKLFYSLEVCTVNNYRRNGTFTAFAVCCYILHKQDMPQALLDFIEFDVNYWNLSSCYDKLSNEQSEVIFQYLVNRFIHKLQAFNKDPYNKELRDKLRPYVYNISNIFCVFKRDVKDLPEIVKTFFDIDLPKDPSVNVERKIITENHLYRFLKTDAKLAADALSHFEENIDDLPFRLNKVLRKLKIYFPNDVSLAYISFFNSWLPKIPGEYNKFKLIKTVIFGLFQLSDETYKIRLMEKYCPSEPKINHKDADRQSLYIQEAICRLVGYSRPPVPLENVLKYMKGDYAKYCLPLFNMYIVNLPLPLAIQFTEAVLNAPLSVQKQGLRAAFKCYAIDDLKKLVIKLWKNTKNISLRLVIYKLVFNKVIEAQSLSIYEPLKYFTSELHQDDHNDIFDLILSCNMSHKFLGDYLQTAWDMCIKLPKKPIYVRRQINIAHKIEQHVDLVQSEYIRKQIIDEHINERFEKTKLRKHEMDEINELYQAKWNITSKYISFYNTNEELENKLALLTDIFQRCIGMWNEMREEKFVCREFYLQFIRSILNQNVRYKYKNYWADNVPVLQHILDMLLKSLPLKEIYLIVWELQLTIYTRIISSDGDTVRYERDESFNYLSPRELSKTLANRIGTLLKELLERHQLYTIFLSKMATSLYNKICYIQGILKGRDNFLILFCESLAALEIKEAHLLILMILPANASGHLKEDLSRILQKIQTFDDHEVQALLYSKFVIGDTYYSCF